MKGCVLNSDGASDKQKNGRHFRAVTISKLLTQTDRIMDVATSKGRHTALLSRRRNQVPCLRRGI